MRTAQFHQSSEKRLVHWRRPLNDGGVEFYFAAGDAKFSGSVAPARDVHGLMEIFEQAHGVTLPAPEIRPMRGGSGGKG